MIKTGTDKNKTSSDEIELIRLRFNKHIKTLGHSPNSYENELGIKADTVSKFINRHKDSIGFEKLTQIIKKDSSLNLNWLMGGGEKEEFEKSFDELFTSLNHFQKVKILKNIINMI